MIALVLIHLLAAEVPPAKPAPAAPPPKIVAAANRQSAEDAQLRELLPPPLEDAAIRALTAKLGASKDSDETVQALIDRYRSRTQDAYEKAVAFVRPRLTAAYLSTPAGTIQPTAGPELVSVLTQSHSWRATLARADTELLQQMVIVRTDAASASPALLEFTRAAERDDMTSLDPAAGIRLPALLDAAGLELADRRRVEDALERQWTRTAAAISARRAGQQAIELQRAQLLEQWGPAWALTATPTQMQAYQRQLSVLDARSRSAEAELRTAARESAVQLLRVLPQDAATRVRDAVDSLMWPSLFVQEELLKQAVTRAAQGAEPELLSAMQAALHELHRRLEGTRRDLSRKANLAEELDAVVASVELGAPDSYALEALQAQLDLLTTVDRRRKLIRAATEQLSHMAEASTAPNAYVLKERLTAIDADARSAEWLRQGLEERIAQLQEGGRDRPDSDSPDSPNSPDSAPGTTPAGSASLTDTP